MDQQEPSMNYPKAICRLPKGADEAHENPTRLSDITWRVFRIMAEFVEGFQFLAEFKKEVTFFGSARLPSTHRWYVEAQKLGYLLGQCGFTVITGGGPGIMEAGNRGAFEANAQSIGLNIKLPNEQRTNPYVKRSISFHYFFTRKVMLAASAQAYVFFPGGFGTLDEFFEILTLVQTKKMADIPIICVGCDFWNELFDWSKKHQLAMETISQSDFTLFQIVDTAEEAFELISQAKDRSFF